MAKIFANGSTGKEKIIGVLFLVFCVVGMGLGAALSYYILLMIYGSYESMPRLLFKILLFISIVGSMPFISVPLFLLGLRPFYTRESVSRLFVSGRNPNLPPGSLPYMNLTYKIGFFCIDLFYPKDKSKGE
jgi:hypothetical protein